TGGMGSGSRNGVILGLHPGLHAPRPQLLSSKTQALRPFLLIKEPALVSRPILKRSRRFRPAWMISNLFLRAFSISRWLAILPPLIKLTSAMSWLWAKPIVAPPDCGTFKSFRVRS